MFKAKKTHVRLAACTVLTLFLALAGTVFSQSQEEERAKIKFYSEALSQPTPAERIPLLLAIIEKWPGYLNARYALGVSYTELGQHDKAIIHFNYLLDRSEEINNDAALKTTIDISTIKEFVAFAYFQIGSDYLRSNNLTAAISALQHAIKLDGANPRYLARLGDVYLQSGNYNSAIEFFVESQTLEQNNASVWHNLGNAYWYVGNFEAAKDAYERCLEIAPNMKQAQDNLKRTEAKLAVKKWEAEADSAMAIGDVDFALEVLQRIEEEKPDDKEIAGKIAELQKEKIWREAVEEEKKGNVTKALQLLGQLPEGYKESARMKNDLQAKLDQQAQQKLQDQQKRREQDIARRMRDAESAFNNGDYKQADARIDALLRIAPNHAEAKRLKAALTKAEQDRIAREQTELAKAEQARKKIVETEIPTSQPAEENQPANTAAIDSMANASKTESDGVPVVKMPSEDAALSSNQIILFVSLFLAAGVLALFFMSRRRKATGGQPGKTAQNQRQSLEQSDTVHAAQKVGAAVEKVDFDELYQNRKRPADSAGTEEFFEKLISDDVMGVNDDSVEIFEIKSDELNKNLAPKPSKNNKDSKEKSKPPTRQDASSTGSREGSRDSFMNMVDNSDQFTPPPFHDTTDGGILTGGDGTRTVDMSQYKVRKIGRYVIEKEIGRGAAGRIYKAWDPKLDRTVVIKTVSYNLTASEDEIDRLKQRVYREARAAAKLNQPNIVVVYDVEDESTFSYIVMEHIEGVDLRELLDNEKKIGPDRCVSFVIQICKALSFAHEAGIVHRDVKPSNILVLSSDKVKVTDFGIAKLTNHLTLTQTGRVVGTPSYMAPEQIEGHDVDARADIFSLGVVFYEILTGQRPFVGDTLAALAYKIVHVDPTPPSLVNIELSPACDEIIGKAIAKDPTQRYQSITEFQKALENARKQVIS